jgi:5-hydroxyisourate hydrolase-like protein (transthyretin family)
MRWRSLVLATLWVGSLLGGAGSAPATAFQAGQAPARDTTQPRTGTARVLGRIVAADSGAPVRRALVRLTAADDRDSRSAVTDIDGRYEFRNVASDTYRVGATKDAWLATAFGTDRRYPVGRTFKVGDGETVANINIALPPGCAITGHILDEFGEGIPNVHVTIYRMQSVGGVRRMVPGGSFASTDHLGQYPIFGLEPGSYYLTAIAARDPSRLVEGADRVVCCPTFYPGTSDPGQAPLRVAIGRFRSCSYNGRSGCGHWRPVRPHSDNEEEAE